MSVFNPTQLMNVELTATMDTTVIPIPEGDWPGVVDKVEFRQVDAKDKSTTYTFMEVTWSLSDSEIEAVTGRDRNTCRQSVSIDLTPHGTFDLAKGKNIQLGRLRDALGQNTAAPWQPGQLVGQAAVCSVKHRMLDSGDVMAEIKRVAAL